MISSSKTLLDKLLIFDKTKGTMIVQVLQDSDGKETGVFIPIEEWNRLKADYPGLAQEAEENYKDGFVLTEEHIKRLEEASAEPRELSISFDEFKSRIFEKYGI